MYIFKVYGRPINSISIISVECIMNFSIITQCKPIVQVNCKWQCLRRYSHMLSAKMGEAPPVMCWRYLTSREAPPPISMWRELVQTEYQTPGVSRGQPRLTALRGVNRNHVHVIQYKSNFANLPWDHGGLEANYGGEHGRSSWGAIIIQPTRADGIETIQKAWLRL